MHTCALWLPWKGNSIHTCLEHSWENCLMAPLTFPSSWINQSSDLWSWDCYCHATTMRSWTDVCPGAWCFSWKNSLNSQLKVVQSSNWQIDARIKHSCAQPFSSWDNSSLELASFLQGTHCMKKQAAAMRHHDPCLGTPIPLSWVLHSSWHQCIIAFYG